MKNILTINANVTMLALAALIAFSAQASADIVNFAMDDDGDGIVQCDANWNSTSETMTIVGDHLLWDAGHVEALEGDLTTDTPGDPTVIIANIIDNDTSYTWTGYTIQVAIRAVDSQTALTNLALSADAETPADWSALVTQPLTYTASYTDGDGTVQEGFYVGKIEYSAGTPVPVGGTVDLRYTLSFEGATSYLLQQEMMPVPEPATMSLLALGGIALLRRRRRS